jgi:sulfite reductase alpha subunit-like flavoprotein
VALCANNDAGSGPGSTRHLKIALPPGLAYGAGDHLGVLPRNGLDAIRRTLLRFKLDPSLYVAFSTVATSSMMLEVPLSSVIWRRRVCGSVRS